MEFDFETVWQQNAAKTVKKQLEEKTLVAILIPGRSAGFPPAKLSVSLFCFSCRKPISHGERLCMLISARSAAQTTLNTRFKKSYRFCNTHLNHTQVKRMLQLRFPVFFLCNRLPGRSHRNLLSSNL